MAHQSSNPSSVIFTICLFVVLEIANTAVVSTTSASSSSASGTFYETDINNGELAIKIRFDTAVDTKLNVAISYDTETKPATDFFLTQLTPDLFKQFSDCNVINWNFMTCGTSKLQDKNLSCPKGPEQCKFDLIHACVATLYIKQQDKIGQFITCFFNKNKNVDECVKASGFVLNDVNSCAQVQGSGYCDAFFTKIHGANAQQMIGIETGTATTIGTSKFQETLCNQLSNAKLKCSVCPLPTP